VPGLDPVGNLAIVGAYVSAQKAQRRIALTGMNERPRALVELNRLNKILDQRKIKKRLRHSPTRDPATKHFSLSCYVEISVSASAWK